MISTTFSFSDLLLVPIPEDVNASRNYRIAYKPDETNLYDLLSLSPSKFIIRLQEFEPRRSYFQKLTLPSKMHRLVVNSRGNYERDPEIDLRFEHSCHVQSIRIDNTRTAYIPNHYGSQDCHLILTLQSNGHLFSVFSQLSILESCNNFKINSDFEFECLDIKSQFSFNHISKLVFGSEDALNLDLEDVVKISKHVSNLDNRNAILIGILNNHHSALKELPSKGIAKTIQKCNAFYEHILPSRPDLAAVFRTLCFESSRTIQSVKVSSVVNDLFKNVTSQSEFETVLQSVMAIFDKSSRSYFHFESIFEELDGFSEKRKSALKSKSTGAFNKMMADLDFVDIDEHTYPLTHYAITHGELPLSVFFRKSESYFLFNDDWALWEEMLEKHRDIALSLAETVKGRTTYEKDLMSYMYFVLHALPDYLEQHTGKKWTGIPKLVTSSSELDPPKEGEGGVAKQRSALTPIVDNIACTVTVPYASLALSGYSTTYCYSLNYTVLTKGLSIGGNVCIKDVEEKLNGKDDYGLMFYTLTGSAQGRGYPTFLIIFERLEDDTFVHFHRTHPMRSKDGDYNPLHQWTKGAYKWMSGNVNFERIVVQQGDLVFVRSLDDFSVKTFTSVNAYDNHRFAQPVQYAPYDKKQKDNILGYFKVDRPTELLHLEHLNVILSEGNYELRQCRSWEANPKGVWSLRID